jgi:ABC-type transport system involved in cytochrome bd biosynthesis, fused ATPase and permease components
LAAVTLVYYLIYNNLALNFELLTLVGFILFRLGPVISRIIQNISLIFFYYPSTKILDKEFKEYSKKREVRLNFKNESSIQKLSINKASFSFGKNKILNNFNYKFTRNNVYGLYGESGKGKSTFLMILSGLIKLDKGNIKINNTSYGNKKFYLENKFGFMSQYNVLLDDSLINTIFLENKVSKEKILKAKYYLTKFKLKKLNKFLKEDKNQNYSLNRILSGGERQRLSINRTILLGGDICFLMNNFLIKFENEKML